MKRSVTLKRTDLILLSAGTLALVLFAAAAVAATWSTDEFVAWAWARHHNVLSWYIRPLFILPFCYFAYRRSPWGIVLTVIALATSMSWFPAPEHSSSAVNEMLASERVPHRQLDALEGPDRPAGAVLICGVGPRLLEALARLGVGGHKRDGFVQDRMDLPLQHRGWRYDDLPAAVLGLAVCDALILYVMRRMRARSSYGHPQPRGHHG
jgi:hypothetical protein